MMIDQEVKKVLPSMFNAAVRAGAAIMDVYNNRTDFDVKEKADKTPITVADCAAHNTIREYLGPLRIPILSEEGREMRYDERRNWEMYWLVDPLDGTVEFIKRTNEFTVNIALMEHNKCTGAVVYVPCLKKLYIAVSGRGAFVLEGIKPGANADYSYDQIVAKWRQLPFDNEANHKHQIVAVSRSHQNAETVRYLACLKEKHPDLEVVKQGSSYKFCLLAEGRFDYYIRTTQTYEWDTAAGELILAEAGGETAALPNRSALLYNEEDLRNPWFVCRSKYCKILESV